MTPHEKGLEAAAREAHAQDGHASLYWPQLSLPAATHYRDRARAIIAAYLAEAQPTSEGNAERCDCGKSMEACAATEDCSGQSMPATSEGEEREAAVVLAQTLDDDLDESEYVKYLSRAAASDLRRYSAARAARSSREGGKP